MKRDENIKNYMKEMLRIHNAKSHDYAKTEDKFSNFTMCEKMGVCSTETGFIIRMTDKLSRLSQLINKEALVKDEKITDTLTDLALYCLLMREYIEENDYDTVGEYLI